MIHARARCLAQMTELHRRAHAQGGSPRGAVVLPLCAHRGMMNMEMVSSTCQVPSRLSLRAMVCVSFPLDTLTVENKKKNLICSSPLLHAGQMWQLIQIKADPVKVQICSVLVMPPSAWLNSEGTVPLSPSGRPVPLAPFCARVSRGSRCAFGVRSTDSSSAARSCSCGVMTRATNGGVRRRDFNDTSLSCLLACLNGNSARRVRSGVKVPAYTHTSSHAHTVNAPLSPASAYAVRVERE